MALLRLAAQWAKGSVKISVLTVDHGLRPEAAAEAAKVAAWCDSLALDHHTLRWEGAKPKTGLQAKARVARYDLHEQLVQGQWGKISAHGPYAG